MRGAGHDRASVQERSMITRNLTASRAVAIAVSIAVTASTLFAGSVPASAAGNVSVAAVVPAATAPSAVAPDPAVPDPAAPDAAPRVEARMNEYSAADYEQAAAELPAGLAEAAVRDLGKTGEEYLATAAAAADAVRVVDALKDRGVDVLGSRLEGTVLVVSVESTADARVVASAGAVAEVGKPDTRGFSTIDFTAAMSLYGGQGYAWENQDGTAGQCSIGFPGYQVSSGKQRLVTAGHCLAGMTAIVGDVRRLDQIPAGSGGTFGRIIGPPLAGSGAYGNGFDTGQIHVNAGGEQQAPGVLTWGGGASYPAASAPVAVLGQSAAIEGGVLCKSGTSTGWSCGNVLAVDEPVKVSGADVNTIVSDACVQPGDSGGAVVAGSLALGIVSGSTEVPCDDPNHLSVFFPMVSASGGPSVQSRYGTTWELAVAVPAPTVTSVLARTTKAAGSISGTLAVANETSRVSLYLDGSTTPYATVSASTGRWSVTLGPLAAGRHAYRVIAEAGTWSRSTERSDYFDVGAMAAPGDVVRLLPGGALYLLDGKRRLVPVPSAAIAAELTSRPIKNRIPEAIAAFTIDTTAKLGTEISCGGESFLAAGGKLWRLAYGPAGLPVTTLDETTCAALAHAPDPLYNGILLRSPVTGDIYLLDGGAKHRFVSMAAVIAIEGWSTEYLSLSQEALAGIPTGRELLAPGSLVKTAGNPAVYLVDGMSRKIPVASFDTAGEYGVRGFTVVADATLDAYTTAPSPLTIVASCSGNLSLAGGGQLYQIQSGTPGLPTTEMSSETCRILRTAYPIEGPPFVRNPATGEVFLVQDGKKSPIRSMSAVIALAGGTVPLFVPLSRTSLDGIPTARELLGPGTLVKTASSPKVYLVDGLDRKVPIDSFDLAAEFGAIGYTTVPSSVLRAYTSAPKNLSLAVTCRSKTYLAGGGALWNLASGSTFGLRATALDGRTCGAFRESAEPVGNALFVRNPATGAVYNVADGRRTYMATMADIYARNGGVLPVFVPISSPVLAKLPTA